MAGVIEAAGGTIHWLEAPGGVRLRAATWPEGARGVVLLLNGRTEYIEKYLETVADWQRRGFAVWAMDWRGQGLSTRPLADRLKHHVGSFDEYLDDAELMLDRLVLPALAGRRLLLMGHSMGGHLAARLLARRPALFARAVLCAPMIDFLRGGRGLRLAARALIAAACLLPGWAERFGPGTRAAPDVGIAFEGNRLTRCRDRYAAGIAELRARPELQLGGCTWGWLRAAQSSIAVLRRPATLRRIGMPVLVACAGAERVVDNPSVRWFAGQLPQGELVVIEGARHELLREQDRYRAVLWEAIDRFVAAG